MKYGTSNQRSSSSNHTDRRDRDALRGKRSQQRNLAQHVGVAGSSTPFGGMRMTKRSSTPVGSDTVKPNDRPACARHRPKVVDADAFVVVDSRQVRVEPAAPGCRLLPSALGALDRRSQVTLGIVREAHEP